MRAGFRTFALCLSIVLVGCMDESRVNSVCRWSDSEARPLDLRRAADREHLRVDAKVAGELGLRFADVRYRNVPMFARPLLAQCRGALYDSIIHRHGVTQAQIDQATMARVWWADIVLVFLPLAAVAVLAMDFVTRRICRAFDTDDRVIATASAAALVPITAALVLGATQFWAMWIEALLLRNGHVSFRASQIPAIAYAWTTYAGAFVLCSAVAALRFGRTPLTGAARPYARSALRAQRSR